MIANEIIFHLMKIEGISSDQLAEKMGLSGRSRVNAVVNQKHIMVDTFLKYLDALGWKLCVVREKDGKKIEVNNDSTLSPYRFDFPLGLNEITRKETENE